MYALASHSFVVNLSRGLTSRAIIQKTIFFRHYASSPSPPKAGLPPPPRITSLETPEEMDEARTWVDKFKGSSVPRGSVELSFSRSSGPGGQNVNKVNSKASIKCPVNAHWIPVWAHQCLSESTHYVKSSHSILITSDAHRSQAQNVDECLNKLHSLILTASTAPIRKEPSEEQKRRVEALQRAENSRRRQEKSRRSSVKQGRSNRGAWD